MTLDDGQPLHVVATAGHVDHGKSSLIVRLTGIDPDRWEEEKRRGLTIDLGFAWGTLPSGREIGFVDVPGHERFVRNMLAGVGPLRLVLFVVAADEGWKPQSEEHLEIVDVLGAEAGVVALTKSDLVDEATGDAREGDVRRRLEGTRLEGAPIVRSSSVTGEGLEELREALDAMVAGAPDPEDRGRPRIDIDRSFTICGAGTVVTGTLTGGSLRPGEEARIYPDGGSVRIRSLQTHRLPVEVARPVSRVAANLAGLPRAEVERGDVLGRPGAWRPTTTVDARIVAVRSLAHQLTGRGAYKVYLGSAERDARIRLYGTDGISAGDRAFARLMLAAPVVAEHGDRFVVREAGRRETVAGGVVLDPHPAGRAVPDAESRLARREGASRDSLPSIVVEERGAVRASDLEALAGAAPERIDAAVRAGTWWVDGHAFDALTARVLDALAAYHRDHPLRGGLDAMDVRVLLVDGADRRLVPALEQGLAAEVLLALERSGSVRREGTELRLAGHRVSLGGSEDEARRLVDAVAAGEPSPPTVTELVAGGRSRELIDACVATGRLVRVSPELVLTPGFAARAEAVAREEVERSEGLTVSRYREALGTTRKYALPILGWLDERGVTRRDGDVRRAGPA